LLSRVLLDLSQSAALSFIIPPPTTADSLIPRWTAMRRGAVATSGRFPCLKYPAIPSWPSTTSYISIRVKDRPLLTRLPGHVAAALRQGIVTTSTATPPQGTTFARLRDRPPPAWSRFVLIARAIPGPPLAERYRVTLR